MLRYLFIFLLMFSNTLADNTTNNHTYTYTFKWGFFKVAKFSLSYNITTQDYIKNDQSILEREPLETIAKKNQLSAYKHHSLWQCLDTKRDIPFIKNLLPKIFK